LVVISPSEIDDKVAPLDLVRERFINDADARKKLKKRMPEFIDNIALRLTASNHEDLPMVELIDSRPQVKNMPEITSISYYNAQLNFNLWKEAFIFAVAVETGTRPTLSL
jgi:hypothetical protein